MNTEHRCMRCHEPNEDGEEGICQTCFEEIDARSKAPTQSGVMKAANSGSGSNAHARTA